MCHKQSIDEHTIAALSIAGQSVAISALAVIKPNSIDTAMLTASIVCPALIQI